MDLAIRREVDNPMVKEMLDAGLVVSQSNNPGGDPQAVLFRYKNVQLSRIKAILYPYTGNAHATSRVGGTKIDQDIFVNINNNGWMPWRNIIYEEVGCGITPSAASRFNPAFIIDIVGGSNNGIVSIGEENNEVRQIECEKDR